VQAGQLEDLRDEGSGDLERGLPLAADAELHGAAGGRALRDRKRRTVGLGAERQPDPAAEGRRAGGIRPDRGQLETADERRDPPNDGQVRDRDRRGRAPGMGVQAGQLGDRDHAAGGRHPFGARPRRLPAHLGVHPDGGLPIARSGHLDDQVPAVQHAGNRS